jgi:hypothetical protein
VTSQTTTGSNVLAALASLSASPCVIRLEGTAAVVLAAAGQDEVQLWMRGGVVSYAADTVALPVTDPADTEPVLCQALASLNALRRQAREATTRMAEQQDQTLAAIRDYAIEAHRNGDICGDGLDEFLYAFDLDEYDPYVGVTYRMTGSVTVAGADEAAVRSAMAQALAPDLRAVRWVKDGTATHTATIQAVRPVRLSDGGTACEVDFVITGAYEVDDSDTDSAEADGWYNLHPNVAAIPAVLADSASFAIEKLSSDLRY